MTRHLGWMAMLTCFVAASVWSPALSAAGEGALFLLEVDSAMPVGLGGAYGAVSGDLAALHHNPAGLYGLTKTTFQFTHQEGLALDYLESINIAVPMDAMGVWGFNFLYHGMPALSDAGAGVPSIHAADWMGTVVYSGLLSFWAKKVTYGAAIKWIDSRLGDYHAQTVAGDLGLLWELSPSLALGLALKNAGWPLRFDQQADSLPLHVILSSQFILLKERSEQLRLLTDLRQNFQDSTQLLFGGEFVYAGVIAFRAGYAVDSRSSVKGLAVGLGLRTSLGAMTWVVDYAYQTIEWSNGSLAGDHIITLGLNF